MTNSSVDSKPWDQDKIDLTYEFLPDSVMEHLYRQYPDLPKSGTQGCPTCQGTKKYVWRDQELECDCQQQVQLYKHYLAANIGLLYQRLTWEDYGSTDDKALKVAYKYLESHSKMTRSGLGLIYLGTFGTGKTMLASLIAKELVQLGYSVFFSTFAEMVDSYTKTWGDNQAKAVFEANIVNSDVFILDDVGKEFRSKSNLAESTFDHVLRQRAVGSRPTILTTNMTESELDRGYGGAIFSLLKERSILHVTTGTDFRDRSRTRTLEETVSGWTRRIQ